MIVPGGNCLTQSGKTPENHSRFVLVSKVSLLLLLEARGSSYAAPSGPKDD